MKYDYIIELMMHFKILLLLIRSINISRDFI